MSESGRLSGPHAHRGPGSVCRRVGGQGTRGQQDRPLQQEEAEKPALPPRRASQEKPSATAFKCKVAQQEVYALVGTSARAHTHTHTHTLTTAPGQTP